MIQFKNLLKEQGGEWIYRKTILLIFSLIGRIVHMLFSHGVFLPVPFSCREKKKPTSAFYSTDEELAEEDAMDAVVAATMAAC